LKDLALASHPDLIVGMEHGEDAGVYRLRSDLAVIQTVDFFTPIVDDPYTFGQIAAANALSDVYAMGGRPLTALNIVCFPIAKLEKSILREILRGGLDKMREAGVLLVGGHSVEDDETKYGLSVLGVVHPDRVLLNRGVRAGDRLILTKPLGTGIAATAIKAGEAAPDLAEAAIRSMAALNAAAAAEVVGTPGVHACTDITGFGLLGHACEMIEGEGAGILIHSAAVPHFAGVRDLAETGILPAGLHRNRAFRAGMVTVEASCPEWLADIFYDPQTSGGLFVAVAPGEAEDLLRRIREAGVVAAAIVGEVTQENEGRIRVI
jgi:selenide, water dikinase